MGLQKSSYKREAIANEFDAFLTNIGEADGDTGQIRREYETLKEFVSYSIDEDDKFKMEKYFEDFIQRLGMIQRKTRRQIFNQ